MWGLAVRLVALVLAAAAGACAESAVDDGKAGATDTAASGGYLDAAAVNVELRSLAGQFPDRARMLTVGRSWEGREILALAITTPSAGDASKPNVYILGGHHGSEWIGVMVPLLFGRYVLQHPRDPAVERALQTARFYVVPALNPDGLDFSRHNEALWRKNRRNNGDGTWGVDLNRNYPLGWSCNDASPASPGYRGPEPFSEPESQGLRDFMLSHPPAGVIEYHSFGQIIYPPLPRRVTAADIDLWSRVEPEMARLMRSVSGRVYTASGQDRTYVVGDVPDATLCGMLGQVFNWTRDQFGAPSFLIELPPASSSGGGQVPESDIDGVAAEQLPAILYFADYVVGAHASGDMQR